jgi:hypothetical protein
MARVLVTPNRVWASCEPGETKTGGVMIQRAPAASNLTASITGGEGMVTLREVVVYQRFERPMSEEEIRELPAFPPSIRENARRNGRIEETTEFGRSDGTTVLSVPADAQVSFAVAIAAPAQHVPDVVDAQLRISAREWDPIDAPLHILVGRASITPQVIPANVGRVVEPGEESAYTVMIESAPSSTKMVAFVENGESFIDVKNMIALRTVRRPMTEEEIAELPPFPSSVRERARREGSIEFVEAARSLGDKPLVVERGQLVTVDVRFAPPARDFPLSKNARLVIDSPTWHRVEIPLRMVVGVLRAELSSPEVTVRQGGRGDLDVTLTSVQGPATDVRLGLGMGEDQWHIEPQLVHVPEARSVRTRVSVVVGPTAPVGTYPPGIELRYFEDLAFQRVPFQINVLAAAVHVRLLHPTVALAQGGRATAQIDVRSEGGYKLFNFRALSLPDGVTMTPVTRELGYGADSDTIPLEFVAAPHARPIRDDLVTIGWTAGDETHTGQLQLRLTVTLTPESRTFEQVITTPSGTALGGRASLTIHNDGRYTFSGHMHGSGFDPYAFRISVIVRSRDGVISVAAMKSGSVGGTIGGGSRDFDWSEPGHSFALQYNWAAVRDGQAEFGKWYTDTGVLGTLEDIAAFLSTFFASSLVVGPHVAGAILIGSELGQLAGVPFAHPAGLAGLVVVGGAVCVLGPGMLLPALVAGIAVGAQVETRPMRPSERAFADTVFAGTIPFDRILITNLDRGGRAFCVPNLLDGSILLGMGGEINGTSRFEDPLKHDASRMTLIHELTHAWQLVHNPTVVEVIWQAALNEPKDRSEIYQQWESKADGRPWSEIPIEDQAQIVGFWYSIAHAGKLFELQTSGMPVVEPVVLDSALGMAHRTFRYIQNHVRMGVA